MGKKEKFYEVQVDRFTVAGLFGPFVVSEKTKREMEKNAAKTGEKIRFKPRKPKK